MYEIIKEINAPDIDRLVDNFKPEWKDFFKNTLDRIERKLTKNYLHYRTRRDDPEWCFSTYTALTIENVNQKAKQFYWQKVRYQQLTIPGFYVPELPRKSRPMSYYFLPVGKAS